MTHAVRYFLSLASAFYFGMLAMGVLMVAFGMWDKFRGQEKD